MATAYRPVRTESQGLRMRRNPSCAWRLAATRRQVIAMGVSLWFRDGILHLSPDGTTRDARHSFRPVGTWRVSER